MSISCKQMDRYASDWLAELIPILRMSITYVVLDFDFATLTFAFKTFVTRL